MGLFAGSLVLHALLWRWRRPSQHTLALVGLFGTTGALLALLAPRSFGVARLLAAELLHFALACAYIQTYPALQSISPSLIVLLLVEKAGSQGLTLQEMQSRLGGQWLIADRLADLLDAGLATEDGGQLQLTARGALLVVPFIWLRKALGLRMGQG